MSEAGKSNLRKEACQQRSTFGGCGTPVQVKARTAAEMGQPLENPVRRRARRVMDSRGRSLVCEAMPGWGGSACHVLTVTTTLPFLCPLWTAVIDRENGKPHVAKRMDRPRIRVIPE